MLAFDTAREARLSKKESQAADMDQKLYDLEMERTRNLGNMTSVLLMLASSMDTLTRYKIRTFSLFYLSTQDTCLFPWFPPWLAF